MTYTLWSHGRLLGEAEFTPMRYTAKCLIADLRTTPIGESVLPIATGVARVSHELERAARKLSDAPIGMADFNAACQQREALNLELRAADGTVIPTEWISVYDTEALTQQTEEAIRWSKDDPVDPAIEEAVQHDLAIIAEMDRERKLLGEDEPWSEPEHLRYHVQATLLSHTAT